MIYLFENNNPNCDKWIFLINVQINFGLWDCTWESVRYHLCFMQVSVSLSKSILQCCVHLFLVSVLSNQCVEYYFIVLNREAGGFVCDALFKWQLLVSVVILTCTIAKKDIVSETCIFPSLGWILSVWEFEFFIWPLLPCTDFSISFKDELVVVNTVFIPVNICL